MGAALGTLAELGAELRVLVTGNKGYIGTSLVPMLLERGHEVSGLDSDLFSECTFVGEVLEIPQVDCDVRDIQQEMVGGFDAIIHLAGLSNDPLGDYDPKLTIEINEEASVRLAGLAKQARVKRFLFASSCSNYGAAGNQFLTEDAAFNPVTPYGKSKVNVERRVGPLADDDFTPTYLRASTAYGLSPRIRFDLVLNNLTAWACTTGQVYLKSDGTPWRPIVHVEDIARAYVAILEADRSLVHNQAFNIGNTSENYRIMDLAEIVQDIVPDCQIEMANDAGPDKRCYRVDCNRLTKTLHGFKPQWTARIGVEQLYDSFSSRGLTVEEFEGERFKRIAHIKRLIVDGKIDSSLRRLNSRSSRRLSVPAE